MHRLLVAALLWVAAAGCVNENTDSPDIDEPAAPVIIRDDVAAAVAASAGSVNLRRVGEIASGGEEADAWGDFVFVDRGTEIAILAIAVAPNGTVQFAEMSSFSANVPKDVKVSDDGRYLFTGNDDQASGPPLDAVRNGGIDVWDVSDKAAPNLASHFPIGQIRGSHMVFYHRMTDGSELVLGANGDVSINRFNRESRTLSEISRYAPNPITDVNRDPQVIDAYYQLYTHDIFAMNDWRTNQTLMYTASWDAGLRIVDLTNPSSPVEIGAWNDYPDGHTGNLHTVSTEWIGDRRITVGAVEVGFQVVGGIPYYLDQEKSVMYVWDTTDPASIKLLGTWENPWGYMPGATSGSAYSTHNLQLENGRVTMAHYGLGVWLIDISTADLQSVPKVLAFDQELGSVWDVIVHQGVAFASGSRGTTALYYEGDLLGSAGVSSRA